MALTQPPLHLCKTPLQRWVSERGYSAREFTAILGEDYNFKYISYVISGSKKPSVKLAKLIEQCTEGTVKAIEMLDLDI